ncbi:MAG: PA0069 family radical SAM protein [Geminicoccaceae bacterium]
MLPRVHRGRGSTLNLSGRFERHARETVDDGWGSLEELADAPSPATQALPDRARSIIARNQSPDVPFDQSINPYRGCEHGCVYCYARPSHGYLGLSAGVDFETRIFVKHEAAQLLRQELARPGYLCKPISLGANTDAYQPLERRLRITRQVLEVLAAARHPVGIVTKSAQVTRDIDLLAPMARDGLARVYISITTLSPEIARTLEPRAAAPHRRLEAIRTLAAAGITTGVMVAPIIPALTDHEIEPILAAAADAGAVSAGFVLVRLPYEVKELMAAWLDAHFPGRATHVLSLIRQCRDGRLNDPEFGSRMRGSGVFAQLITDRFRTASRRHGFDRRQMPQRTDLFRPPRLDGQFDLFGA